METVTTRLRQMILAGELDPGARLLELPLAERLGGSRTPLRLVLGELEQCLAEGRALTDLPSGGVIDPLRWAAMNVRFHWAIVRGRNTRRWHPLWSTTSASPWRLPPPSPSTPPSRI
jgi:DNA-binding GntR family transcriptional regulator